MLADGTGTGRYLWRWLRRGGPSASGPRSQILSQGFGRVRLQIHDTVRTPAPSGGDLRPEGGETGAPLEGVADHGARLEPAPGRDGGRAGQKPRAHDQAVPYIGPPRVPIAQPAVNGGRQDEQQHRESPGDGVEG